MPLVNSLSSKQLYNKINPKKLDFLTTDQIDLDLITARDDIVAQSRAKKALQFGLGIKQFGYNLFVMGPTGIGRHTMVFQSLNKQNISVGDLLDICYTHNFSKPLKPISITLPAGKAQELQGDLTAFIEKLFSLVSWFKNNKKFQQEIAQIKNSQNEKFNAIGLLDVSNNADQLASQINNECNKTSDLYKKALDYIMGATFISLKKKYHDFSKVEKHLNDIWTDLNTNISKVKLSKLTPYYYLNIIVNNKDQKIRPIYYEKCPSYSHLFGVFNTSPGNLADNFSGILPGSLHKANGGYLIIDAEQLLTNKTSWNILKSALASAEVALDYRIAQSHINNPINLFPYALPLDIKLILIGDSSTYEDLIELDSEFKKYFKVIVDFDEQIELNKSTLDQLSLFIARFIKERHLLVFANTAIARLVEYTLRLNDHSQKMLLNKEEISNLLCEASYWAELDNKNCVTGAEIDIAITELNHRTDRLKQLSYNEILSKDILIDTAGRKIGQINGLSIVSTEESTFGQPSRITATARLGDGKLVDVENESDLGGDVHTKGVLILSHFLASRYARNKVFSVSASISFEQSYGGVDGDSASAGELCALLSAISEIPINQGIAITGSINQLGEIQVIGDINEKIESFFDICLARQLTGTQGVIIPAENVKNLMLKPSLIAAVKANSFYIFPIQHIDEAIPLLTGLNAGQRQDDGQFEANTLNYVVEQKLEKMAQITHEEAAGNDED